MRSIRLNTCNFCCIYLLNNKNLECRHAIRRVYTCSFSIFWLKVLNWNFFMLLLPFAGWFFLFKALIKKILIWSVFTLLVTSFFLLAAFSLKFAVFAVNLSGKWKLRMRRIRFNTWNFCCVYLLNNKNLECRHAIRRVLYMIPFQYFVEQILNWNFFHDFASFAGWFSLFKALIKKKLIWSVFTLLVASFFLLAAFSLKFPVFAVNLSGKWKLRMRRIRFNTWNFCCVYLLNNKNLECRHAIRRVLYMIPFQYFVENIDLTLFHAFGRIFVLLAAFFLLNIWSKKYWFEVVSRFWSSFLLAAFEVSSFCGQFERKMNTSNAIH